MAADKAVGWFPVDKNGLIAISLRSSVRGFVPCCLKEIVGTRRSDFDLIVMTWSNQTRPSSLLLVEDETLIRMMLAGMVEEIGHRVVGEAGSVRDACRMASTVDFDLALLDVNLDGHNVGPVAEIIAKRGLPIVFVTGYSSTALPDGFSDRPLIQKPFTLTKLRDVVDAALSCRLGAVPPGAGEPGEPGIQAR